MNYAAAIERHRQPLIRLVAALYAMIGLAEGGSIDRLSGPVYRKVLNLLGPAEWAVRRLIIVMAQGLVVKPQAARAAPARGAIPRRGKGKGTASAAGALRCSIRLGALVEAFAVLSPNTLNTGHAFAPSVPVRWFRGSYRPCCISPRLHSRPNRSQSLNPMMQ